MKSRQPLSIKQASKLGSVDSVAGGVIGLIKPISDAGFALQKAQAAARAEKEAFELEQRRSKLGPILLPEARRSGPGKFIFLFLLIVISVIVALVFLASRAVGQESITVEKRTSSGTKRYKRVRKP